jgi:hypothetical protein
VTRKPITSSVGAASFAAVALFSVASLGWNPKAELETKVHGPPPHRRRIIF